MQHVEPGEPDASAATSTSPEPSNVVISKGTPLSCRKEGGATAKLKECGDVSAFDAPVSERLRKLASCSANISGKLSAVVTFDFRSNRVISEVGKSTNLNKSAGMAACLKQQFQNFETQTLVHEHARYVIAYSVTFKAEPEAKLDPRDVKDAKLVEAAASSSVSNGEPTVAIPEASAGELLRAEWEPTIVRETPIKGDIVSRLSKGNPVRVLSSQGSWYKVSYGKDFTEQGWVYKNAVMKPPP
jgi:Bacterial SH3 domain